MRFMLVTRPCAAWISSIAVRRLGLDVEIAILERCYSCHDSDRIPCTKAGGQPAAPFIIQLSHELGEGFRLRW